MIETDESKKSLLYTEQIVSPFPLHNIFNAIWEDHFPKEQIFPVNENYNFKKNTAWVLVAFRNGLITSKKSIQEDHDGPISLTWIPSSTG